MFGGQEDWRGTDYEKWHDPKNNFSNRLFRQDLKTGTWKELHTQGAGNKLMNIPSPRSQSFCFVRKDQLYIYGGYNGSNLFSDLYRLDLRTLEWNMVKTTSTCRPKELAGTYLVIIILLTLSFPLTPATLIFMYWCEIHKLYSGLLKPPDLAQPVNYKPLVAINGKDLFVVEENFELLHLDLNRNIWNELPSNISITEPELKNSQTKSISLSKRLSQYLKSRRGASLVISDKTLYVTGGEDQNSNNEQLIISCYNLPRKLEWSSERLLWLACFKNNVGKDKCLLSQCPPMIIYKIISYINSDIFMI